MKKWLLKLQWLPLASKFGKIWSMIPKVIMVTFSITTADNSALISQLNTNGRVHETCKQLLSENISPNMTGKIARNIGMCPEVIEDPTSVIMANIGAVFAVEY
jgi:hypothetical protein